MPFLEHSVAIRAYILGVISVVTVLIVPKEEVVTKPVETTVFKSGNSQAVRIPVTHRLVVERVTVEHVPEGLLLRPVEETIGDALNRLRAYQAAEGIEGGLLEEVEDLPLEPLPDFDDRS